MTQQPRGRFGWSWWPLAVHWSSTNGFVATVRASFLIFLGSLVVMGWLLQGIAPFAQGEPIPDSIDWSALATFVALALLGTALHEGGHVLGYHLAGIHWTGVTARYGASVHSDGELNDRQQIMVSALGPGLQALFGVALMALTAAGSMAWLGGVLAVANGVLNLFVPLSENMDSTKIYRHLGRILMRSLRPRGERIH